MLQVDIRPQIPAAEEIARLEDIWHIFQVVSKSQEALQLVAQTKPALLTDFGIRSNGTVPTYGVELLRIVQDNDETSPYIIAITRDRSVSMVVNDTTPMGQGLVRTIDMGRKHNVIQAFRFFRETHTPDKLAELIESNWRNFIVAVSESIQADIVTAHFATGEYWV